MDSIDWQLEIHFRGFLWSTCTWTVQGSVEELGRIYAQYLGLLAGSISGILPFTFYSLQFGFPEICSLVLWNTVKWLSKFGSLLWCWLWHALGWKLFLKIGNSLCAIPLIQLCPRLCLFYLLSMPWSSFLKCAHSYLWVWLFKKIFCLFLP
jgi:hypothetical protein